MNPKPPDTTRPNILFLFTDQQARNSLSCYGNTHAHTPSIDRMAKEGVVFEKAYTTTPICSPARASLHTGLYPFAHGMQTNLFMHGCMVHELADSPGLLSRRLCDAGYQVGFTGKWHLGYGTETRDDPYYRENFSKIDSHLHDIELPQGYRCVSSLPTTLGMVGDDFPGHGGGGRDYPQFLKYLRDEGIQPEIVDHGDGCFELCNGEAAAVDVFLRRRTEELIKQMAGATDSFCMMLNFWGPHEPYYVPSEWLNKFTETQFEPWPSFTEDQSRKPKIHAANRIPRPWSYFQKQLRFAYAYAAFIDDQIGKLLAWLEPRDLLERTQVIFSADHGDSLGIHDCLYDKSMFCYEETCSIPLIIRPAGGAVSPGRRVDAPVSLVDIYSTLLDYAGVPEPLTRRHGRSLRPWVEGASSPDWPETVVTESSGISHCLFTSRMIRKGPWKYVFNCGDRDELYHLINDPHEMNNLVFDPYSEAVLLDMMDALESWMHDKGDDLSIQFRRLRPRGNVQCTR